MSNDKHDATYHGSEPNPRYDGINNPEPYDWKNDPVMNQQHRPYRIPGWFWAAVALIIVVFAVAIVVAK